MVELLTGCDFRKVHEFLFYLLSVVILVRFFFSILLRIADKYTGLMKQLLANGSSIGLVAFLMFELWLVDEKIVLGSSCANARVDLASFLVWVAALLIGFLINYYFFGAQLRNKGFYKR